MLNRQIDGITLHAIARLLFTLGIGRRERSTVLVVIAIDVWFT
jgi:hypothetical protein